MLAFVEFSIVSRLLCVAWCGCVHLLFPFYSSLTQWQNSLSNRVLSSLTAVFCHPLICSMSVCIVSLSFRVNLVTASSCGRAFHCLSFGDFQNPKPRYLRLFGRHYMRFLSHWLSIQVSSLSILLWNTLPSLHLPDFQLLLRSRLHIEHIAALCSVTPCQVHWVLHYLAMVDRLPPCGVPFSVSK